MKAWMTIQDMKALFADVGLSREERAYLEIHAARCIAMCDWISRENPVRGSSVLDVGSGSILPNSVLLAASGANVTALDSAKALRSMPADRLARKFSVRLLECDSLEAPGALGGSADNSFDMLVLAEVLEHLTFNPVQMWRELLRVLKPGGKVYLTTPNYHGLAPPYVGMFYRDMKNILRGRSSGLRVERLLAKNTRSHHWKEYSACDLRAYFKMLSAGLIVKALAGVHVHVAPCGSVSYRTTNARSGFPTRAPGLMVALCLQSKNSLVDVMPEW